MHMSIALIAILSLILIIAMVACFMCFVKSRQKEEQELVRRIQQQQLVVNHRHQQPNHPNLSQNPSRDLLLENSTSTTTQANDFHQTANHRAASYLNYQYPTHLANKVAANAPANRTETIRQHTDITQQINSAVIGSSEAEFQNDFIQVFPMYHIAPMPEKNTTPYLN